MCTYFTPYLREGTVGFTRSVLDPAWWSQSTVDSMKQEYTAGLWGVDKLLGFITIVLKYGFWQSHTLSHLMRDNLGQYDCDAEDGGKCFDCLTKDKLVVYP